MYKCQNVYQHYLYTDSLFKGRISENSICEFPAIYIHQLILTTATLVLTLLPLFFIRKLIDNAFSLPRVIQQFLEQPAKDWFCPAPGSWH